MPTAMKTNYECLCERASAFRRHEVGRKDARINEQPIWQSSRLIEYLCFDLLASTEAT